MIQRIQTLFLLLAILSLGFFLWMPLLGLESPTYKDQIPGWNVTYYYDGYLFFINPILSGTAAFFLLVAIFLFKSRSTQKLHIYCAMVFTVAAQAYVYYRYQTKVFEGDVVFTWWNLLSAVALLFELLALWGIRRDEQLLASADRLR